MHLSRLLEGNAYRSVLHSFNLAAAPLRERDHLLFLRACASLVGHGYKTRAPLRIARISINHAYLDVYPHCSDLKLAGAASQP